MACFLFKSIQNWSTNMNCESADLEFLMSITQEPQIGGVSRAQKAPLEVSCDAEVGQ